MTWLSWHTESERLASHAHHALQQGDRSLAQKLFKEAAEAENRALLDLDPAKQRTLGITAVSAVSLLYKAEELQVAEKWAVSYLGRALPSFASEQLRQLLQSIWTTLSMRAAGVAFLPGQVMVAVRGGETVVGGAPLDLIVEKVQTVQALFYRTIELVKGLPYRRHGPPSLEIQEACRPWLFHAVPNSYQFAVAIQQPPQQDFFKSDTQPEEVADRFLSILKASSQDPDHALANAVPDADYRTTFLKLARNLAPTGKNFDEIEVRASSEIHGIVLGPENRRAMNTVLRPKRDVAAPEDQPDQLRGVLRNLHLDDDWLDVLVDGQAIRVEGLSEAIDDVIGPMVNRPVIVHVIRRTAADKTRSKTLFVDIETQE